MDNAIAQIEKILGASVKRVSSSSGGAAASGATASDVKCKSLFLSFCLVFFLLFLDWFHDLGWGTTAAAPVSLTGVSISTKNGVDLARISVHKRAQSLLIGGGGAVAKRLQETYDVRVRIPGPDESSTEVTVQGAGDAVRRALAEIAQLLGVTELTSQPFVTASFTVSRGAHGAIIGSGGSTLQNLEKTHRCRITVPKKTDNSDVVTAEGTSADLAKLKTAIEALVQTQVPMSVGAASEEKKSAAFTKIDLKVCCVPMCLLAPSDIDCHRLLCGGGGADGER